MNPVVRKVVNAMQFVSLIFIFWMEIYPVDSAIHRLNNRDLFAQYVFVFINFDLPTPD